MDAALQSRSRRCVFFDFFGTLVHYSPSRRAQGYARTHRVLREAGLALGYEDFLDRWERVSERFEAEACRTHREYGMQDLGQAFFADAGHAGIRAEDVVAFVETYVDEWCKGVRPVEGLDGLLERLGEGARLGIITNTHDPKLVPGLLERFGVARHFDPVVTSVGFGVRKPARAIFDHALELVGADAAQSVYVGDNPDADYRGARSAGWQAYLIDPDGRGGAAPADRLVHLRDLEESLGRRL